MVNIPTTIGLPSIVGSTKARNNLSDLLNRVERGETFIIKGPNREGAMVLSVEAYRKLQQAYLGMVGQLETIQELKEMEEKPLLEKATEAASSEETELYTISEIKQLIEENTIKKDVREESSVLANIVAAAGRAGRMPLGSLDYAASPVYELASVLFHAVEGEQVYDKYTEDAEAAGDEELARFFREVRDEAGQRIEQAQELLAERADIIREDAASSASAVVGEVLEGGVAAGSDEPDTTEQDTLDSSDKGLLDRAMDKLSNQDQERRRNQ